MKSFRIESIYIAEECAEKYCKIRRNGHLVG